MPIVHEHKWYFYWFIVMYFQWYSFPGKMWHTVCVMKIKEQFGALILYGFME